MAGTREIAILNGKKGGRPRGSVATSTKIGIKTRELFAAEVDKHLETIFNALLVEAKNGNIPAIRELLDRAWGKPAQAINLSGGIAQFSLKELHEYREKQKREAIESRIISDP